MFQNRENPTVGQHKTKYACIVEADESMRIRMEGSQSKNHEDHIAGKGVNSLSHHNLVHKFTPMPEAMKIPDAKAAVEKEWEKLEKIPAWQLAKVRNKNEVIADILTKGNFTRDEWNNLLCLFNISHFSSLCCAKNFSLISCTERMAKRMQEQSEENRIVAKSRPTTMNLTSSVATSSSSVNSPIASRSPGILKASSRQVGLSGGLMQAQIKIPIPTQRRLLKDGKGMLNC